MQLPSDVAAVFFLVSSFFDFSPIVAHRLSFVVGCTLRFVLSLFCRFGTSSRTSTVLNDRIEGERKREERILAKTETLFGYMDMNDDKSVDKDELVQFFSLETGLGRGQAK